MEPILEVKHLSKSFGKKQILHDISFSVNPGEIYGFLGPNGAGKSTTIKTILGLLNVTEGDITINGYHVTTEFEKALAKVGSIIESPELYDYMTGYDNLKLFANMYRNIDEKRIKEVVKIVKLENRIHDKVKKYSLGMKQRLGIAQALLHRPNLIILDEPTNGLDPVGIKELREMLRDLAENSNVAILVSSHLLSEMELMCDRVCIIDAGKVITVQSLTDAKSTVKKNTAHYEIKLSDSDLAESIVMDLYRDLPLRAKPDKLELTCSEEEAQTILKELLNQGIIIHAFAPKEKTLEDAFLEITTGSTEQIR